MGVMMSGTKNGIREDYEESKKQLETIAIIVDDANSTELARLLKKYRPETSLYLELRRNTLL